MTRYSECSETAILTFAIVWIIVIRSCHCARSNDSYFFLLFFGLITFPNTAPREYSRD